MNAIHRIWSSSPLKSLGRVLPLVLLGGFASANVSRADTLQLFTDTTWRAIGPAGNLEGSSINSVGSAWEAANLGWNTSLSYNDSTAAGWHSAIASPLIATGNALSDAIWSDGNGYNGSTPSYFRTTFTLSGPVTSGLMNLHVDDDSQVYLNGTLVWDDHDFTAGDAYNINIASYLVTGQNLLAIKAHDSYGLGESLAAELTIQTVPEPSAFALAGLGAGVLACWRRRK